MELLFGDCLEVMNNWIKSGEREKFDLANKRIIIIGFL